MPLSYLQIIYGWEWETPPYIKYEREIIKLSDGEQLALGKFH